MCNQLYIEKSLKNVSSILYTINIIYPAGKNPNSFELIIPKSYRYFFSFDMKNRFNSI